MQPAAMLVKSTTRQFASQGSSMSGPYWVGFRLMNSVHWYWRRWRKAKLYTNPDNFLKLIGGHATNHFIGDKMLVKVAAQCVLIATRILECVDQHKQLQRSWKELKDTIKGEYIVPLRCEWNKKPTSKLFSPSTIAWIKIELRTLVIRIYRFFACLFKILRDTFLLSMRIMDAVESFSFSPEMKNEAVNEFYINMSKWMDKLVQNKEVMVRSLERNRKLITKILGGEKANITVDSLIRIVRKAIEKVEKANNAINGASNAFGKIVVGLGKQTLYDTASIIGLNGLVPKQLMPPPTLFPEVKKKSDEQFPNDKEVTVFISEGLAKQYELLPAKR